MSDIINTGLGWWANEDWLKDEAGIIGSISSNEFDSLKIPVRIGATTGDEVRQYGVPAIAYSATASYYFLVTQGGDEDVYMVRFSQTQTVYIWSVLLISKAPFTVSRADATSQTSASMVSTSTGTTYQQVLHYNNTGYGTNYTYNTDIKTYIGVNSDYIFRDFMSGGSSVNFYKLNSGYAITCFMRWLNANQEELVAPILVSTVSDYTKISLDGQTEAPGIVTGIEFGDMTFYVNILLGYSGDVTASVPYQDITTTFPAGINITELFRAIATFAQVRFTDPYAEGGHSEPGGGGGTFDLESDIVGVPSLPTMSFAATGFTRIYNPTLSELNSLANYLWTDTTFLDTVINHLKQLLENPMDAIISLALLPCPIPNGSPEAVKVMFINTGVTMAPATSQFVEVDCGTYALQEFYGSALDYNPYTKVHCYLPYIGQVTLDTDEVMGKTIHVRYRIDIVTGMCAALISVNQSAGLDETVMYQFSGHCSINMPINSADFSGYIGAAMTAGKMVAGVVAGATGNIPLAAELIGAPAPHSSTTETKETVTTRNPKTGRQNTQWSDTKSSVHRTPGASFGEMSRKAAANTVGSVMGSKLTVEHAGGFTGNSGYLAVRRPYLIIERPRMCNPEEYGKYNGRPSMIYMNLGECEGYTEVQSIQFDNIPATNPELAELSELLKSGVLF